MQKIAEVCALLFEYNQASQFVDVRKRFVEKVEEVGKRDGERVFK
jgi:hypothetical protein